MIMLRGVCMDTAENDSTYSFSGVVLVGKHCLKTPIGFDRRFFNVQDRAMSPYCARRP